MNPNLEDRLHNLADDLSAPPTEAAREAIGRRTGKLRRRRQTRRAVGAGVLVVALVAGLAAVSSLRNSDEGTVAGQPDVSTGQPESGPPAWTVDLPGWEVASAAEYVGVRERASVGQGSIQVFRAGDDPLGPTVLVRHTSASDVMSRPPGSEIVEIGSVEGYLDPAGPERYVLSWSPPIGDSHVEVLSYGLGGDELVALATGLVPRDDSIIHPPAPDDVFGFEATDLPAGLEEVASTSPDDDPRDVRRIDVDQSDGEGLVSFEVDDSGATFVFEVAEALVLSESVEQVEVIGQEAYLFEGAETGTSIVWRQGDVSVRAGITETETVTARIVLDNMQQMSEDEWRANEPTSGVGGDGACCG